jgi:rhodanese-related sulfurtransferase
MKKFKQIFPIVILLIAITLTSCSDNNFYNGEAVGKTVEIDKLVKKENVAPLAEIYYNHGNFINTKAFPPIVQAHEVFKNKDNNWLLIDIRGKDAYEAGHVNGAYNVPKEDIYDFLTNTQKAAIYDKVVIICYTGQIASYVTGVLRYAGFDNIYTMFFGMAAWNSQFSDPLIKGYGHRYEDMIERIASVEKPKAKEEHGGHDAQEITESEDAIKDFKVIEAKLPQIGKSNPAISIIRRARILLKQPRTNFLMKADEFFEDYKEQTDIYYPIFYLNQKKFEEGYVKGSHLYESRKDLSLGHKLIDIPKEKEVLIYCKTGHTSGNAAAYLNMMGYKTRNLMFGYNSYRYDELSNIVNEYINDYPIVAGKKRTNNKITSVSTKKRSSGKVKIVRRKKKAVSGGCG